MFTGNCEICNEAITPAKSSAQFARNLGLHKRNMHGVVSSKNASYLKYKALKKGKRKYNKRAKVEAKAPEPVNHVEKVPRVEPIYLERCPSCSCRFYLVRPE